MTENEIAAWIASNGHGVVGTSIFVGDLPDRPVECIAVAMYGGDTPLMEFGEVVAERPRVQVMVRASDYATARERAGDIFTEAARLANVPLSGVQYLSMLPVGNPIPLGRNDEGHQLVSVNLQVIKRLSP